MSDPALYGIGIYKILLVSYHTNIEKINLKKLLFIYI